MTLIVDTFFYVSQKNLAGTGFKCKKSHAISDAFFLKLTEAE